MNWYLKIVLWSLFKMTIIIGGSLSFLWWAYQIKTEEELYLDHAWGVATITREPDTLIAHIRG